MRAPAEAPPTYVFGPFHLDLARQELRRDGQPLALTPKAFDTLRVLVEAGGAVVTKDELLTIVWRDRFVEESVLSQNVYTLRKLLGEGEAGGSYIVTVARRGYRFGVPVEKVAPVDGEAPSPEASKPAGSHDEAGRAAPAAPEDPAAADGDAATEALSRVPAAILAGRWDEPRPAPAAAPAAASSPRRRRLALLGLLLLAALAAGVGYRAWRARAVPTLPVDSLAVLPFVSLTPSPEGDMLGLAMADALITRLSSLQPLVVRPTSAVQDVGRGPRDPLPIGKRLDVDAVMDGSLQRAGDRLRVSLRLLRVRDGRQLWAGTFEAVYTDPFSVQDAISAQVADALSLRLSGRPLRAGNRGTRDNAAYQEYVRGRYFWNRRTEADLRKAMAHFRQALDHDPTFAAAHAGLADCWALLPLYGGTPPRDAFPRSIEAARDALRFDPDLAEAHTSLAYSRFQYEWDWEAAEDEFRTAMRLDPGYPTAPHWYAYLLSSMGRHDEAVTNARLAQRLDPLSLVINADLGLVLYFARRHDEAIAQFAHTVELDPNFAYARFGGALAYSAAGRHDEAVAEARRAVELSDGSTIMWGALGNVLGRAGREAEAREVLAALAERGRTRRVQAGAFALVHVGLGEKEQALRWLEEAYEERSRFMVFLQVWPIYDDLREEPRFHDLIRFVALPAGRKPVADRMGE